MPGNHVDPAARLPGSPERNRAVALALEVQSRGGIAAIPKGDPLRRHYALAIARAAGLHGLPGDKNGADKARFAQAARWVRDDVARLTGVGAISRRRAGGRQGQGALPPHARSARQ